MGCLKLLYQETEAPLEEKQDFSWVVHSKKGANVHFFALNAYGYGFNGQEKDNEWSGGGNSYDFGARIYNPQIAKFFSIDPLSSKYPMFAPYQFANNSPIAGIDLKGLEYIYAADGVTLLGQKGSSTELRIVTAEMAKAKNLTNDYIKTVINYANTTFEEYEASGKEFDPESLWIHNRVSHAQYIGEERDFLMENTEDYSYFEYSHNYLDYKIKDNQEAILTGAQITQYIGSAVQISGHIITIGTGGLGAPLGEGIAAIGVGLSITGSSVEAYTHYVNSDYGQCVTEIAVTGVGVIAGAFIPGSADDLLIKVGSAQLKSGAEAGNTIIDAISGKVAEDIKEGR